MTEMIPPSRPRDVMVTLRVTEAERNALNKEAANCSLKPAELMRMALSEYCGFHWQDFTHEA